jgi:hypothetical protein
MTGRHVSNYSTEPSVKEANLHGYHVRKWYSFVEETHALEAGPLADGEPLHKIIVAASIFNPYAGAFSNSLEKIVENSALLGEQFGRRLRTALAGRPAQSYGKAAIVGLLGEYEHGNAFLTNAFADPIRAAVGGGKAWFPSTGKRGPAGTVIDVPLAHKDALYVRSHYDTITAAFADAPALDEVVVIVATATRGRLHARLGGLKADEIEGLDGLR